VTTQREYAISLGLAKPTRGRMSADAWAAIHKAEADGMKFTETVPTRKVTGSVNANPLPDPDAPERKPGIFESFAPTPDPVRKGYLLFVKENGGTIKVNSTEACRNCTCSFSYCRCGKPTFVFWRTGEEYTLSV
jgi:hypothetical protein